MQRCLTEPEGGEGADEIEVGCVGIVVRDLLLHRILHSGVIAEVVAHCRVVFEFRAASPGRGFTLSSCVLVKSLLVSFHQTSLFLYCHEWQSFPACPAKVAS